MAPISAGRAPGRVSGRTLRRTGALSRAVSTSEGNPTVRTTRSILFVATALCGLVLACSTAASACGTLDAIGSLAPGFGNACVSH